MNDNLKEESYDALVGWRNDNMAAEFHEISVLSFIQWCLTLDTQKLSKFNTPQAIVLYKTWLLNPNEKVTLVIQD